MSKSNTSRPLMNITHSITILLYCFTTRVYMWIFFLLLLFQVYFILPSGRSRSSTWNISFSVSASSIGPCTYVVISISSLDPPEVSERCFSFTLILYASLSQNSALSFLLSSTPANFSMVRKSSWFPPIPFHTYSTTLSHLCPARSFVSPIQPYPPTRQLFLSMFHILFWHFNIFASLFVLSGYSPISANNHFALWPLGLQPILQWVQRSVSIAIPAVMEWHASCERSAGNRVKSIRFFASPVAIVALVASNEFKRRLYSPRTLMSSFALAPVFRVWVGPVRCVGIWRCE